MTIRKGTINDIDELVLLFDDYRVFYEMPSDIESARTFISNRISQNESEIFVAEFENKLVGFVQLYPLFSSTRMKKLWLLNDLFVNPNYRNKGISIALIEEAKKLCINTKACGMMLETAKSNIVGNNLYPKTGFELDKDHNYYEWSV